MLFFPRAGIDDVFEASKGTATYKEDIGRINLNQFLMWMFPSPLGRHISNGPFKDLK